MTSPTASVDTGGLLERLRAGERTALARAISLVENLRPGFEELLHAIHRDLGRAHRIGITGPPGAGKSTITAAITGRSRARDERVGIVAIDPTSAFTGGALLGDRIRMNTLATDPGVFIRSMATRGALGGLALTTKEVTDLLDAFGFDRILTETVGVGQSELDIAETADTTVVVLVPESGDGIQAMKAGLMEIADVFVVNKSDRPGADRLVRELEMMLHMRSGAVGVADAGHHGVGATFGRAARERAREAVAEEGRWSIPVLRTIAQSGEGIDELLAALDRHRQYLRDSGELERRRRRRFAERTRAAVARELALLVWRDGPGERMLRDSMDSLIAGDESPYSVAARIVSAVVPRASGEG